ncbi:MAG: DUF4304 domain-containing protein [Cyanobacteria bacterium SZAS TMP-1]|nr:DUF4304 domain-containing protein [Cyanobacteria bacterium SZAS TMP-1]
MASRKDMHAALKKIVVPNLRIWTFKGTYPHFRRIGPTHTDLLGFQFDKYGLDRFIVEISQAPGSVTYTTRWGEQYKMDELKYFYVSEPRYRLQPGLTGLETDWFDYSNENYDEVACSLLPYLERARMYFADNSQTEGLLPVFGSQRPTIDRRLSIENQEEYERLVARLAAMVEDYRSSNPATELRIDRISESSSKFYRRSFICALEVADVEVSIGSFTPGLRMITAKECLEFRLSTVGNDLWWFTKDLPTEQRRMKEGELAAFIFGKWLLFNAGQLP